MPASGTGWIMMLIRRRHVWSARKDTCLILVPPRVLHAQPVSCTARRVTLQRAQCVLWADTRVRPLRQAASIVVLVSTQTAPARRAAPCARVGNTQQLLLPLCVVRVVPGSMLPQVRTAAWSVLLGRVTMIATRRRRVWVVRVVGTRLRDQRAVICVQLVRLTWTLMPRHRALFAHRGTTLVLARPLVHHVQLVSMMMTRMRAQHVCRAE